MTTSSEAVVSCRGLVRLYRGATGETYALRGVDADFATGRLAGVLGPSGSGKSSLLRLLALRERPDGGRLELDGRAVTGLSGARLRGLRRRSVAWIAQRPTHGLFPHLTADEHVTVVHGLRGVRRGSVDVLDEVDLGSRGASRPPRMSGGEQQRLAVAMALVGPPQVIVADEPTAELDDESAALVLAALLRAARAGSCVIVATHDARLIAGADRVLLLRHGVLSTDRDAGDDDSAVIDSAGRLQLPPEALALFPDGRARVRVEGDHVRLDPRGPA